MASITMNAVAKRFGRTTVLHGIDMDVADGEFVVFVGPSGCGKSTLLRLIAGLDEITSGTMSIGGERVNDLPPKARGIAMVFQSYALYPHMTAYRNMAFGMRLEKAAPGEIDARVRAAAEMLELTPLLDRLPRALSGGQRQRVAIGRAIVREPRVLLFDEPLSNLDASLRGQMRVEIARLHERLGNTMVYVTHDQVEAMTLADRIVVLNAGRVEQVGTPLELYHRPANRFVAGFIGAPPMNFLDIEMRQGEAGLLDGRRLRLAAPAGAALIGVRPEDLIPAEDGVLKGRIALVEELGETHLIHVDLGPATVIAKAQGASQVVRGEILSLAPAPARCHFFDAEGARLGAGAPLPATSA
ncbi:MAG: sn-glycerol-3-phosphate ABC transporter ATP-binding protein UgpC [Pseudomonadota bacterium]